MVVGQNIVCSIIEKNLLVLGLVYCTITVRQEWPNSPFGSDMAVGPFSVTHPNPTHDFTDPT